MQPETLSRLLDLNRQFYHSFARSFADTRRRIQPGVRQVLAALPPGGDWLDLGCGSGALALEWVRAGRSGSYTGLDFSPGLLEEARQSTAELPHPGLEIEFIQGDLSAPGWDAPLRGRSFHGALSFAVLHHLPGRERRAALLHGISALLPPGAEFILSVWQYQHAPRLLARVVPWEAVGIRSDAVEAGDTLIDWRAPQPGGTEQRGLRYVHLFTQDELEQLAAESGFSVRSTFESDGEGGRLGLYQVWQRA